MQLRLEDTKKIKIEAMTMTASQNKKIKIEAMKIEASQCVLQQRHDGKGLSLKQNKNENNPCKTICE